MTLDCEDLVRRVSVITQKSRINVNRNRCEYVTETSAGEENHSTHSQQQLKLETEN